jgi:hypothetical protein
MNSAQLPIGLALAVMLLASCVGAQTPPADSKPAETKPVTEAYQTFYLVNTTQQNEAIDIQTALRNTLPKSRLYFVQAQNAITMHGTPEDIQLAQKMISELDRPRKSFRLTYTITETEGEKRVGTQHFALIVTSGTKIVLRQGNKVPVFIGENSAVSKVLTTPVQYVGAQVQYQDVGMLIEATADEFQNGVHLRSKVSQSSLAEDKSGLGAQDPIIRETVLEGVSTLVPGKTLNLGSLDIPGSKRKQDIEVVIELVR